MVLFLFFIFRSVVGVGEVVLAFNVGLRRRGPSTLQSGSVVGVEAIEVKVFSFPLAN